MQNTCSPSDPSQGTVPDPAAPSVFQADLHPPASFVSDLYLESFMNFEQGRMLLTGPAGHCHPGRQHHRSLEGGPAIDLDGVQQAGDDKQQQADGAGRETETLDVRSRLQGPPSTAAASIMVSRARPGRLMNGFPLLMGGQVPECQWDSRAPPFPFTASCSVSEIGLPYFGAQRRRIQGATTRQCSFIVRRSDTEDGAVPPEPLGPMEVPGRRSRTVPVR